MHGNAEGLNISMEVFVFFIKCLQCLEFNVKFLKKKYFDLFRLFRTNIFPFKDCKYTLEIMVQVEQIYFSLRVHNMKINVEKWKKKKENMEQKIFLNLNV